MSADKTFGKKIMDILSEDLQEDVLEYVKGLLIEKGEVKEVVKPEKLTPEQQTKMIDEILDKIG